ncbi:MAG: gamma-glutamyl-gamma-aminobutyrate hydrolase family protein [Synergistaceae bacterium]|nr:gamma-glutamyl-gamma-aminobutyrate hydrolase family protein [Synergistaceae bacterium]
MRAAKGQEPPVVGISINVDSGRPGVQNILEDYVEAVYNARCTPFVVPLPGIELRGSYQSLASRAVSRLDGLLLSGGDDVDARLYDDENMPFNGAFSEERDLFEIELCRCAVRQRKPILGICRGVQVLNVAMGGSLFQDIERQNAEKTVLMHSQRAPGYSCVHEIECAVESQIGRALSDSGESPEISVSGDGLRMSVRVNSFHHQAVRCVAPGFKASAYAPDGIIEAIEPTDYRDGVPHPFTIGVQWHPERLRRHYRSAERLFAQFAEACTDNVPERLPLRELR